MVYSTALGDRYTYATFQAFVDAVIPPTLQHSGLCEAEYVPGAAALCIHEFVIMEVDLSQDPQIAFDASIPFSRTTAELLDIGAARLLRTGQSTHPPLHLPFSGGGLFSSLSRIDRLRAVELLNRLAVCLRCLPPPYRNNPALVQTMMNSLQQLTLFGFYSEWYGYGTTRWMPPDDRKLEFPPPSWRMVGYPGPSFGYRGLRGFLLKFPNREGGTR